MDEEEKQTPLTEEEAVDSQPALSEEEKMQEQIEEYKDKYFRTLAEMENSRKRLHKEKHDMTKFAVESALSEFFQPIDQLENALKFTDQMSPEVQNWAMGFKMIATQFHDLLSGHGISSFDSQGKMFDPNLHEAVEVEESEEIEEGTIVKEFVKGYKSGDRTLRPARVKVAKRPVKEEKIEENSQEDSSEVEIRGQNDE